jgi:hypothetical protein
MSFLPFCHSRKSVLRPSVLKTDDGGNPVSGFRIPVSIGNPGFRIECGMTDFPE